MSVTMKSFLTHVYLDFDGLKHREKVLVSKLN